MNVDLQSLGHARTIAPGVNSTTAPVIAVDQRLDVRKRVLAAIEKHTSPVTPPKVWEFLGVARSVRQLQGKPADLVTALRARFTEDELRSAEIVIGEAPRLAPVFSDSDGGFVVRRDKDRSPIDVISPLGVLTDAVPEWRRVATAYDSVHRVPDPVLLAFEVGEMLIFHRLGLLFTSGAGLERLCGADLVALSTQDPLLYHSHRYRLTLPGWQVAAGINKPCARLQGLIEHLLAIHSRFALDPKSLLQVWFPTEADFRKIRRAIASADRNKAIKAITASLKSSSYGLDDVEAIFRSRDHVSYGEARHRLQQTISNSAQAPLVADAKAGLDELRKAFDRDVISKLLRPDPAAGAWEAWRSLQAVELARTWFENLPLVRAAQTISRGARPGDGGLDLGLAEVSWRTADAFAKLHRSRPPRMRGLNI